MPGSSIRAVVRGDVQRVCSCDATAARARELRVSGWVRSDDDGVLRVHAEGAPAAVDELVAFLRAGPAAAGVETVVSDGTLDELPG